MTAREIIAKRLCHEGTRVTPYDVQLEPKLHQRLTEHYGDPDWFEKKIRKFTCTHLRVDTVLMRPVDDVYAVDGYGARWRMDRKPWHLETPPLAEPAFGEYQFPSAEMFVAPIVADRAEAARLYEQDTEHYRIISMGWGIFEHTWRIRGFENAMMDMLTDKGFYRELTQRLTDNYIAMLKACEDVPADAYLFGDDWGDQRGVMIGVESWRKFIKPCWARIYEEVHRQGKVVIQHSCGSIADLYDDLAEIGMDCHESVQPEAHGMAPERIKALYGKKVSFWGCLGTQGILYHGSPAEIRGEIYRLHHLFQEDGGYVLAPSKPLPDEMELDKAIAVIETLAELNG